MDALGKQPGRIPVSQQDCQAQEGEHSPQHRAPGWTLAQQPDAEQYGEQGGQSHHQADLGGPQGLRCIVAEGLVEHHAKQSQRRQLQPTGAQAVPDTPHPTRQKRRQNAGGHHPAGPGKRSRREHANRQFANNAIASPDGNAGERKHKGKGHHNIQKWRDGDDKSGVEYRVRQGISKARKRTCPQECGHGITETYSEAGHAASM